MSERPKCPVCGGEMHTESWFDEEGIEAWRCDTCNFGEIGDWSEPPDHSADTDDTVIGFRGETLGELRAAYNTGTEPNGWVGVKARCESDVMAHKIMRERMLERGWLKGPTTWRP